MAKDQAILGRAEDPRQGILAFRPFRPSLVLSWLLLFTLLLGLSSGALAEAPRTVVVGSTGYRPIAFTESGDRWAGLSVTVLDVVAAKQGWKINRVAAPWPELLKMLESGEIDVLEGITYSAKRAERFEFSNESIMNNWAVIYAPVGTSLSSLPDLNGRTVAVSGRSAHTEALTLLAEQFGITFTPVAVPGFPRVFDLVLRGEADAGLVSRTFGIGQGETFGLLPTPIVLDPTAIHYAAPKGSNRDILAAIDAYLVTAKADPASTYNRALEQWVGGDAKTEIPVWLIVAVMVIGLSLILTLISAAILRRQVKKRTFELGASEKRFLAIADHSPSAIFLKDTDGRFIFANRVWHDMYNPAGADLADKTIHDYLPPEIADPVSEIDAKVLKTGVPFVEEQFLPNARGEWQNILSTKFAVRDGDGDIIAIGAVNTDITGRVAAEQALRESEERFRGVFENSPTALSLKDMEGRFQLVNPKFTEWFGAQLEDMIGKTTQDISPTKFSVASDDLERKVIETGGTHELEHDIPFADGTLHSLILTKFPVLGPDKKIVGVGTNNTDITEHRQTELALRQAQKMEAVGQLTGGVAHDFNNLLAVILGNTELLQDEIGDSRLLASIDRAATRGAELTQRLLAFSRKQTLAPQSINLTELLPGLDDLFHRTLGEPVKILTDVPEDIWPVLADPGQLENALLNLAINARDAMPDGGILQIRCSNMELQEGDIRVGGEVAAGDFVQIAVRDTGSGMPEGMLEHVFEPFYTTKDVGEGSGLGLSMVYGFARQSGGNAEIESELGTGTEVRLLLPRSVVASASDEPIRKKARKRGQGEAILVLEDEPDVRSFTVDALEKLGYRVFEAADANAAMHVLEEEAGNVDLLLSDVVLPGGISGPEFAAKVKDLHPQLRVIFMTGYTSEPLLKQISTDTNISVLNKPFRRAVLADAIEDTLAV